MNGANATFVAELYTRYLERPESVDPEWGEFFSTLHDDARALLEDLKGPSWAPRNSAIIGGTNGSGTNGAGETGILLPLSQHVRGPRSKARRSLMVLQRTQALRRIRFDAPHWIRSGP